MNPPEDSACADDRSTEAPVQAAALTPPRSLLRQLQVIALVLTEMCLAAALFSDRALRRVPRDPQGSGYGLWLVGACYAFTAALQYGVISALGAAEHYGGNMLGVALGFAIACRRYPAAVSLFFASGAGVGLLWTLMTALRLIPAADAAQSFVPSLWHGLAVLHLLDRTRRLSRQAS